MKKLIALLLLLCMLPLSAMADTAEKYVYVRTNNITEEFVFPEGTPVLEIVFPRVFSSDCAIIRFGDETMMIDASTKNTTKQKRIYTALQSMGIDHIDVAFNSHPHDDHIDGFSVVNTHTPIGKMLLTFEEDFDEHMIAAVQYCNENNIPIEHVGDGDVLAMGENGEVTMRVIQRNDTGEWSPNNRSAMLLIQYGDRSILFAGDVENHAQRSYYTNIPEGGIDADILKYPHHGQVELYDEFLAAISPELAFVNGAPEVRGPGRDYLKSRGVDYVFATIGLVRMRTDGNIWVVDYMYEINPDRETVNPKYKTTTNVP